MPQDPEKEPSESSEIQSSKQDSPSPQDTEAGDGQPPIPPEVLENLPADQRGKVLEFFAASMQVSGPMANPLFNKIESQHITEFIKLGSQTIAANASDRKHSRLINFFALALLVAASLTVLLVLAIIGENDLLLEIVKLGGVGIGGFGGGYGFSAWRNRN